MNNTSSKKVSNRETLVSRYERARMDKDEAYDNVFFFGVKTTGIFCKPSCPSPIAKSENVLYFESVEDALEYGLRPCKRCHPMNLSKLDYKEQIIKDALKTLYDIEVELLSVNVISQKIFTSERNLRDAFHHVFDMTPLQLIIRRKLEIAWQLLISTDKNITEIALDSGFQSVRQFNDQFKNHLKVSPQSLRLNPDKIYFEPISYEIPCPENFQFDALMAFVSMRLIKGVEAYEQGKYLRTFDLESGSGYIELLYSEADQSIKVAQYSNNLKSLLDVHLRIKNMFDLNSPIKEISHYLSRFEILKKGFMNDQVPRISMAFDSKEFLVRAILGQQISVKAATTLAGRIVMTCNRQTPTYFPKELQYFFPNYDQMLNSDLNGVGITAKRLETLLRTLKAYQNGQFHLEAYQTLENLKNTFGTIKGIGDWTVNYLAMRGIGIKDSFPAMDLGVIRVLEKYVPVKEIEDFAEPWRPYRAYATHCLWAQYNKGE